MSPIAIGLPSTVKRPAAENGEPQQIPRGLMAKFESPARRGRKVDRPVEISPDERHGDRPPVNCAAAACSHRSMSAISSVEILSATSLSVDREGESLKSIAPMTSCDK
jgi:hypothetical protein